jgi:hypothetical protein
MEMQYHVFVLAIRIHLQQVEIQTCMIMGNTKL